MFSWIAGGCSVQRHRPYVLPTVVCQSLRVPSSEPLAYSSPSGEKHTQCTGPKCPLKDSMIQKIQHFIFIAPLLSIDSKMQIAMIGEEEKITHRSPHRKRNRTCTSWSPRRRKRTSCSRDANSHCSPESVWWIREFSSSWEINFNSVRQCRQMETNGKLTEGSGKQDE